MAQAAVIVVWFGYGAHRRTGVMGLPAAASFPAGRGARLQIFKLFVRGSSVVDTGRIRVRIAFGWLK